MFSLMLPSATNYTRYAGGRKPSLEPLQEIRTLRREIQLELRGHEAGSPARTALGRRQAALDNRLARLSSDRQALYRTEADLRSESTLRRQLTGQSWYREHAQRDALATSGPALDGDTARSRWEAASVVDRHVWLEARRRTLDPDLGINQRPTGTPGWAVPGRGLTDPSMPKSWVEPLTAMGQQVSNAITTRGAALALDPPAWSTTYLGAVPADATRRARWESLAGQIETWRGLTDHQDPVKALPTPRASHDASRQAVRDLHVLHAAAADLRRDSLRAGLDALIPPAGEPTPGLRVPQTALEGATERVPLPPPRAFNR